MAPPPPPPPPPPPMDDSIIPTSDSPHAVVFPYPSHGHITPTLILALHLAAHRCFSVTFILPDYVLQDGGGGDFDFLAELGLDFQIATISDGFPVEFDRLSNMEALIREYPGRVDEVIGRMRRPAGGWVLVADSLHTWPAAIAEKYGMVNVSVWTASAAVLCLNYHVDLLVTESGHLLFPDSDDPITFVPGVESITRKDLMSYVQDPNAMPGLLDIAFKAFGQVKNADFILCNTVQELEPKTISTLNQKQPTYAIGPINFFDTIPKQVIEKAISRRSHLDYTGWLDSKPPGSVLYISSGSTFEMSKHDIMDLARDLLACEVNFLWVLKVDDDENVLPKGFVEAVKGRGLVVPWCDQNAILSSPSVGGFFTHCGWNSIMESMWCGVPMVCHPIIADQPTNVKLVVDDWKIGLRRGGGELGSKIDLLMRRKVHDELMEEAKKARATIRGALEKDGSSRKNFALFLEDLNRKMDAMRKDG